MNAIGLLLLILFGLMIFVGRGQGVKAFIGDAYDVVVA